MEVSVRRAISVLGLAASVTLPGAVPCEAGPPTSWRSLGPNNLGGRTLAFLTDPADPSILWAGSAQGLWASIDEGAHWAPKGDEHFAGKMVSALLRDPRDANVMYAGTGSLFSNFGHPTGGIYRSIDRGVTWTSLPWESSLGVTALAMTTAGARVILAGTGTGGVRRSTDDGRSWEMVLASAIGPNSFPSDTRLSFDPRHPNRAIAAVGQATGYSAYYSRNMGRTWTRAAGFSDAVTALGIAYAPSDPDVVYATPYDATGGGAVWRSADGGQSFSRVPSTRRLDGNAFCHELMVSPTDRDLIVVGGTFLYRSEDRGANFTQLQPDFVTVAADAPHLDTHGIAAASSYVDAVGRRRVYVATDGGIYRTDDIRRASSTSGWTIRNTDYVSTQYFSMDISKYSNILGGMLDTGVATLRLPAGGSASHVSEGDAQWLAWDSTSINSPASVGRYYTQGISLFVYRCVLASCDLILNRNEGGFVAMTVDPNEPRRLFAAAESVYRTDDATVAAPDWRRIRTPGASPITAMAVQPGDSNTVWIAHMDGAVFKTSDALDPVPVWTRVAVTGPAPLPSVGFPKRIVFAPEHPEKIYICDLNGSLVRSDDGGTSWSDARGSGSSRLPAGQGIPALVVHPFMAGWLFAATEAGLYSSEDDGLTWVPTVGIPGQVEIRDLMFTPDSGTLVVATFGRGLWAGEVLTR
jgi:photosystem II stability/assembly factor-like uncharacterized protein